MNAGRLARRALFERPSAPAISGAFINAVDKGVRADADDNGPAIKDVIDDIDSQGATIVLPEHPSLAYRFKRPTQINKNRVSLIGIGQQGPAVLYDLTAYAGPLPKHGFILGDPSVDPSAGNGREGNWLGHMRVNVEGGVCAVYAQRANAGRITNLTITGAGLAYGIRQIAGDSRFRIEDNIIGNANSASAPDIGISVENGANQTEIFDNIVTTNAVCVEVFNSVGVKMRGGTVGCYVNGAGNFYGLRIRNDQPVPPWLTWIFGGIGAKFWCEDVWFEDGEALGATIYNIYIGYGAPTANAFVGAEINSPLFLGTTVATHRPIWIDYADGASVKGLLTWAGTIEQLIMVTANSNRAVLDHNSPSTFNQTAPTSGSLVVDHGVKTGMPGRPRTWGFSGADYVPNAGTWVVDAPDALTHEFEVSRNRMTYHAYLVNTSCSGGPTALNVLIPGGWTATKDVRAHAEVQTIGGPIDCCVATSPGSRYMVVQRTNGAAFPDSVNTLNVQFTIPFPVDD